jgi:DNA-3-methyladenine glycosylase I
MNWGVDGHIRCAWLGQWAGAADAIYRDYHDTEWGVPVYDRARLFEMLILEGAQAGLSWISILKRRQSYREAFDHFDIEKIAGYTERDAERLLGNSGIIRNRAKIAATQGNARAWLALEDKTGDVPAWLWQFVEGKPRNHSRLDIRAIPATTPESEAMSRALKKLGFRFVGGTICQSFMQAVGMFNDHTVDCFRHKEIATQLETSGS